MSSLDQLVQQYATCPEDRGSNLAGTRFRKIWLGAIVWNFDSGWNQNRNAGITGLVSGVEVLKSGVIKGEGLGSDNRPLAAPWSSVTWHIVEPASLVSSLD